VGPLPKVEEKLSELTAEVCESIGVENGELLSEHSCRICLSETFTPDNPLINICACMGSVKFMHIDCLQNWMKTRLNVRSTSNSIS